MTPVDPVSPGPVTVWMVHKETGRQGVRGELILAGRTLIFRPEVRGAKRNLDLLGETVLPLADVRKAERARGTPVLEVWHGIEDLPAVVLFYFVKPPDIYSSPMMNPRSAGATYLANSNLLYREEIDRWVGAIEAARQMAGR
jgi:hypothetical protein